MDDNSNNRVRDYKIQRATQLRDHSSSLIDTAQTVRLKMITSLMFLSATLLGILLSLFPSEFGSPYTRTAYLLSATLLLVVIAVGCICGWQYRLSLKSHSKILIRCALDIIGKTDIGDAPTLRMSWLFQIGEILCYLSFLASMAFLIQYAYCSAVP